MYRKLKSELIAWKNETENPVPLFLCGNRNVGKTWLIQEFADTEFKNCIYINFERMPQLAEYFDCDSDVKSLLIVLEEYFCTRILPGETIIVFDEIQACPNAYSVMEQFAVSFPEYRLCAVSSLLTVSPCKNAKVLKLHPLSFDEFLMAMDMPDMPELIFEHFKTMKPMSRRAHREMLEWYRRYLVTGGMPLAVERYRSCRTLLNMCETQSLILNSYCADMERYTDINEAQKLKGAFTSIPSQLCRENKKFHYRLIRKGATAGMFGDSLKWLIESGMVLQCTLATDIYGMNFATDTSTFKLYLPDVGLLAGAMNTPYDQIIKCTATDIHMDALVENYVAQALTANGYELHYMMRNTTASEVDFIYEKKERLYAVEVQTGEAQRAKGLRFIANNYEYKRLYVLSDRNFDKDRDIRYIPVYAAFCL